MDLLKRIIPIVLLACLLCACAEHPVAPTISQTGPSTHPATVPSTAPPETTLPPETVPPEPEIPSILDFLRIAAQPVGQTMYVWGGGWNEEDTGAGIEAVTLGLSPQWATFAAAQTANYDYKSTRYQIHDGLDCSGYVGWAIYNVLETENGQPGYVSKASGMAQALSDRGLGSYIPVQDMTQWLPGDIMSMRGHVWITVGMCADGSVLLLHASPPGVIFSGTLLPDGSESEASMLAERITQVHFPDWYNRFPHCARSNTYLKNSSAMRWSADVLSDPEALRDMTAEEVVDLIFAAEKTTPNGVVFHYNLFSTALRLRGWHHPP